MSFVELTPRTFTADGVRMYAPRGPGVYGLTNPREWVYIGVSDDIQASLLAHLRDSKTPVMKRIPVGFVYELCGGSQRTGRQERLVSEHQPVCNRPASRYPARAH